MGQVFPRVIFQYRHRYDDITVIKNRRQKLPGSMIKILNVIKQNADFNLQL